MGLITTSRDDEWNKLKLMSPLFTPIRLKEKKEMVLFCPSNELKQLICDMTVVSVWTFAVFSLCSPQEQAVDHARERECVLWMWEICESCLLTGERKELMMTTTIVGKIQDGSIHTAFFEHCRERYKERTFYCTLSPFCCKHLSPPASECYVSSERRQRMSDSAVSLL